MSSIIKPVLGSQLQLGHPLATGLVGLWLFNEGSGNKVFDLSGNNYHGTEQVDSIWQPGKYGPVRYFSGDDYIDIGTPQSLVESDRTVICWVRADDWHIDNNVLYNFGAFGINCSTYTNGVGEVIFRTETGHKAGFDDASMTAGTWHQIGVVIGADSNIKEMFLDGLSKGLTGNTGYGVAAVNTIGSLDTSKYFAGLIDSILVYNRTLPTWQIAKLHRKPFCMFERDPIELWVGATSVGEPPVGMAGAMTTNTGYWGW